MAGVIEWMICWYFVSFECENVVDGRDKAIKIFLGRKQLRGRIKLSRYHRIPVGVQCFVEIYGDRVGPVVQVEKGQPYPVAVTLRLLVYLELRTDIKPVIIRQPVVVFLLIDGDCITIVLVKTGGRTEGEAGHIKPVHGNSPPIGYIV